ncbi:hypothetical protein LCGC14_1064440 [marine sediment metagenome]|uniref:RNA ligase domain-containing protein n=1 Tax=marine sediment metagenome TaxID=412755 RepID=A0A0F9Q312_9ZZZZ
MEEYHKIQSIYKRDEGTHKFIEGQYSLPEFEYLKDNTWLFTEKIDGTNIRIGWIPEVGINIGGRTDNAKIPTFLYQKLTELFTNDKLKEMFPETSVMLCGEGYGAKIQKGGGNYIPNGVDFILFDVKIGDWWLKREDVNDIAGKLDIKVVPFIGQGTLDDAVGIVKKGLLSEFGGFVAEGLVLRPSIELKSRSGHRIITKLKGKDFLPLAK